MTSEQLQALTSREAIRDCLHRYCRGVDRLDPELVRSTYWPEAVDRHGAYRGGADGFLFAMSEAYSGADHVVHMMGTSGIELSGDTAWVETYFQALQAPESATDGTRIETFLACRYIDRFECRAGDWRVFERLVVYDWIRRQPLPAGLGAEAFGPRQPVGEHFPSDPSYRPAAQPRP